MPDGVVLVPPAVVADVAFISSVEGAMIRRWERDDIDGRDRYNDYKNCITIDIGLGER